MAQHYGVPTRLLDWTEFPQVAMFFAAAPAWQDAVGYTRGGSERSDGCIAVYGLGCHLIKKLNLSLVHAVRHQNPRLRAQAGVFLFDPKSDDYFVAKGRWPSLEDRVKQLEEKERHSSMRGLVRPEARLVKWNLVASESRKLAKLLLDIGVSFESMYPSLESAALAFAYRQKILPKSDA